MWEGAGTRASHSVRFFVEGYLSFCRGCNFPLGGGGGDCLLWVAIYSYEGVHPFEKGLFYPTAGTVDLWAMGCPVGCSFPAGRRALALSMKVLTTLTTSHFMHMRTNIVDDHYHVPKSMVGCAIIRTLYAESTYLHVHGGVQ